MIRSNTCSGLRGAMAFALALQSVHDLPEGHGQTIFTATTAIVVLTVGFLVSQFSFIPLLSGESFLDSWVLLCESPLVVPPPTQVMKTMPLFCPY